MFENGVLLCGRLRGRVSLSRIPTNLSQKEKHSAVCTASRSVVCSAVCIAVCSAARSAVCSVVCTAVHSRIQYALMCGL